jgi:hypothetical protein
MTDGQYEVEFEQGKSFCRAGERGAFLILVVD